MTTQPHAGVSSADLYAIWRRGPTIPEVAAKIGKSNVATRQTIKRIDDGEHVEAKREVFAAVQELFDNPPQRQLKETEEW